MVPRSSRRFSPGRVARVVPALALAVILSAPAARADHGPAVAAAPLGGGSWTAYGTTLRAVGDETVEAVALPVPDGGEIASLAVADDGWYVAGTTLETVGAPLAEAGTVRRLFVLAGSEGGTPAALTLPPTVAPSQKNPVLLTDGGELVGLAWLEGDGAQGMAVRAARWHGDHFGAPERVSETGPGSQVALDGTVLADGAWLLTWSAYDGVDTEIVRAERRNERWSGVEQLSPANETPDSTPTVATLGSGALVAWSRYEDGAYRVVLRRSETAGEWGPMIRLGEATTLYPDFQTVAGRLFLLYQRGGVQEGGGRLWTALELDEEGRPLAQATAPVRTTARPVLSEDLDTFLEPGSARRGWRSRLRWGPVSEGSGAGGAR